MWGPCNLTRIQRRPNHSNRNIVKKGSGIWTTCSAGKQIPPKKNLLRRNKTKLFCMALYLNRKWSLRTYFFRLASTDSFTECILNPECFSFAHKYPVLWFQAARRPHSPTDHPPDPRAKQNKLAIVWKRKPGSYHLAHILDPLWLPSEKMHRFYVLSFFELHCFKKSNSIPKGSDWKSTSNPVTRGWRASAYADDPWDWPSSWQQRCEIKKNIYKHFQRMTESSQTVSTIAMLCSILLFS